MRHPIKHAHQWKPEEIFSKIYKNHNLFDTHKKTSLNERDIGMLNDFFRVQIGVNIKMKIKCILSNKMLGEMKICNEMFKSNSSMIEYEN